MVEHDIEAVVTRVLTRHFRALGVDVEDQNAINAFRDDWRHAHRVREEAEARRSNIAHTAIATAVSAAATGLFAWFAGLIKLNGGH